MSKQAEFAPFGDLGSVWRFLLTAIYIIGMPYVFYPPLMRMVDDARLHFSGTVASKSDCDVYSYQGRRTSRWSVHVAYVAQDGIRHSPDVDTFMWWRKPDASEPCTVRYDPSSPDHVSTNWGWSRLLGRVLTYLILVPIPLLFEVLALLAMLSFLKGSARPRAASNTALAPPPQAEVDWQAGGATAISWRGYCGALIRKRNRRLFVASAILLGLGSAMFWAHPSGIWYWRGFFLGPRLITGQELASREFSPSRAGWVAVAASNSTDTGVEIYHTYSDGQKFLAGHYLRAEVDGHPLVIHVDSRDAHSPFRGTFKPIDGPLKSQLSDHGYASAGDGATASFYLDTIGQETLDGYRQDGFDTLKICVWFLLFGFPALWLAVRRTLNKRQHPFARELAKRGSLAANVQQIDTEVANGGKTFNRLRVTSNWLILEKYWAPVPMRMSDVVRVYYKRDSTGPACFVHDRLGTVIQASMGSKMAHDAQKKIAAMAPQASRD